MRTLLISAGLLVATLVHGTPVGWVSDYGQPLGVLTGQDDAQQSAALGFGLSFAGATYSNVWASTNGFLNLGSPATLSADGAVSSLVASTSPVVAPFYADLDLLDQGTVFCRSSGQSAVITWDRVGAFASPNSLFTFQVQLDADGQITFRYNGLSSGAALGSSLLVGLSPGGGASDPGSRNLLLPFTSPSSTVYQSFLTGASNGLDGASIVFTPTASGFAVATAVTETPEPSTLLLLLGGFAAIWLWRKRAAVIALAMLNLALGGWAQQNTQVVGKQADGTYLVPTGQPLQPFGVQIDVQDRPLGMVVSPDGSTLAVVTASNFNSRALHLIDLQTKTLKQNPSHQRQLRWCRFHKRRKHNLCWRRYR